MALNGLFPDTIEPIRAAFNNLLPQKNIRVWYAPSPARKSQHENIWRRKAAELIREALIASLKPDVIFIPHCIEGYQDGSITSIGLFSLDLITVVAIDTLAEAPIDVDNRDEYIRMHEHLKRANLLLVLPPLTLGEVCRQLELPQERVNVGWMFGEAEPDPQDAATQTIKLLKIFNELTIKSPQVLRLPTGVRPKLAYVSPLPPERSGIADYSAELLPQLVRYYDIDVIVAQAEIASPWITANCGVRTVDWFLQNAHRYNRVLYHFGNYPYHQQMFDLLDHVPGVVVLHDFHLGDIHCYREAYNGSPHGWTRALYESHGYGAVAERFRVRNDAGVVRKYPANLGVLQQAQGVIVHSEYSRHLASEWYGKDFAPDWKVIPLLRTPSAGIDRAQSRTALGWKTDDFVVCSFGILGPSKLNHRLLEAWLQSRLAVNAHCVLVFVGDDRGGDYGAKLRKIIRARGMGKRIRIIGWVDMPTFRNYLAAADIAVQLRVQSRGETSGAVLDCMNHALPTIANANGCMSDLPSDAVWMLPDAFEDGKLALALETLWQDGERRTVMGALAREVILTRHAPRACARQYAEAIEQFYSRFHSQSTCHALTNAIAELDGHHPTDAECRAIARSLPVRQPVRQFLLDVSAMYRDDLRTGIQRVARALVMAMLESPPTGYRTEPVYLTKQGGAWHYRYARRYTLGLLECPQSALTDEVVEPQNGDVLLALDLSGQMLIEAAAAGLFNYYRNIGVAVYSVVYDLLPLRMPQYFPQGMDATHTRWLHAISKFDGAFCISRSVADELGAWLKTNSPQCLRPLKINWFHLGSDVNNSVPTCGLPGDVNHVLKKLAHCPNFLTVGTVEPRKGYAQLLEAFDLLWAKGIKVNLVIIGKQGWMVETLVKKLRTHSGLGKRLFWFEGISDEYLEKIYSASTCLIAASEGEGFGLPLIEVTRHKLPIIARDIPVFREVIGEHGFYFKGLDPLDSG